MSRVTLCWLMLLAMAARAGTTLATNPSGMPSLEETPRPISSVTAFSSTRTDAGTRVTWRTDGEIGVVGFMLYHRAADDDSWMPVCTEILPALLDAPQGGTYAYLDTNAGVQRAYYLITETYDSGLTVTGATAVVRKQTQKVVAETDAVYVKRPHGARTISDRSMDTTKPDQRRPAPSAMLTSSQPDKVKLTTVAEGLYRVEADAVAGALGLPTATISNWITNGTIEMSNQGSPVAWHATPDGAAIQFFGEPIDTLYSGHNAYWIEYGTNGVQTLQRSAAPTNTGTAGIFRETCHFEERNMPVPSRFNDPNSDFWMWTRLTAGDATAGTTNIPCNLPSPSAAGWANLALRVTGLTDTAANPDHHIRVSINGVFLDETLWNGLESRTTDIVFSQALLTNGTNTVSVEAVLDAGVPYSYVYVDYLDLSYDRLNVAQNDTLLLTNVTNGDTTVIGFATNAIAVYDVTDPRLPVQLLDTAVESDNAAWQVTFESATTNSRYIAVAGGTGLSPSVIEGVTTSTLGDASNAADYLLVCPASLIEGAQALAAYREGQGLSTRIVDIQEIYNAFGYGIPSVSAMRSFFATACTHWSQGPSYIVLVGNGSYDFRDYRGYGDALIPTLAVSSYGQGLLFTDTRLADVDSDGDLDVSIGRLPVLTAGELATYIDKIKNYESGGDWKSSALFACDNADDAGNFAALSDSAAALLPPEMALDTAYLGQITATETHDRIITGFNTGRGLINYIGHAILSKWANEGLLTPSDLASITNAARPTVVLAMSCDFGRFCLAGYNGLAEDLVIKPDGGAVAVWGSVGLAWSSESKVLNEAFLSAAYATNGLRLGDAVTAAVNTYRSVGHVPDMWYAYNLLGDPATVFCGSVEPPAPIAVDFGDAPSAIYATALGTDGARHVVISGIYLGAGVDAETNAVSAGSATSDDDNGSDDEDGVEFLSQMYPGAQTTVRVTASTSGVLNAWIDFNGDGDWNDPGEQIFIDHNLATGDNTLSFSTPVDATIQQTFARFRFSTTAGLAPTGLAPDGEVEDYAITLQPTRAAISDIVAYASNGTVVVRWQTAYDNACIGFLLESQVSEGAFVRLTESPVLSDSNAWYQALDPNATAGQLVRYRLVEVSNSGELLYHGPYELTVLSAFDYWQTDHFTSQEVADGPCAEADADADGDGHTNFMEFMAGTDPRDANSVLSIDGMCLSNGRIVLSWTSYAGRSYLIEERSPQGTFVSIAEDIPPTPPTNHYAISPSAQCGIFRLRLAP